MTRSARPARWRRIGALLLAARMMRARRTARCVTRRLDQAEPVLRRRILDALARLPSARLIGPAETDARVGVVRARKIAGQDMRRHRQARNRREFRARQRRPQPPPLWRRAEST